MRLTVPAKASDTELKTIGSVTEEKFKLKVKRRQLKRVRRVV